MHVNCHMKKLIIILTLILVSSNFVYSQAGLVWKTESEFIKEGETNCIEYGLYNPWPEDSNAALYVSGDLVDLADRYKTEIRLIKANTLHENAIYDKLCFTAPKNVYKEDCILPTVGCQQTCNLGNVIYEGQISAISDNKKVGESGGSNVLTAASAPLSFVVKCEEHPRDYKNAYLYSIIIIALIIVFTLLGFKKSKQRKK